MTQPTGPALVDRWTGRHASALQSAMRMSQDEMAGLRRRLAGSGLLSTAGALQVSQQPEDIQHRLDEALVMLRISYLEKLHAQLGQSEAIELVVKLLVPITTVSWYGYKYYKGMP